MEGSHNTVAFPLGRGERPLYAEPQTPVSTNIALNALIALIFVLTVSTNKIPYSIHNSIALIFCIDCLDMSFNVHSNYNADFNMKTLNYSKVRFKPLIYFELEQTSN